ncbi:odorant receptor 13a-like [Vespula squamosa]|uniref:Odorant receptor 13a-like n=1 Tax=Vespula squamosa TaxID=30214 RepID=A0ABD2BAG0_VESSQ
MIISGYLGIHCFFASIGFRLIGQLAILKCKVKNVFNNTDGPHQGIRKIILGHHRLIRLADLFEDSFNIVIGQHLFRTTILLCIPRYRMLSSLAVIETEGIITFSCDELYFCDWCELPTMDMKSIWICMMRCSKHLRLTCAKFCILSVRTFIDPSCYQHPEGDNVEQTIARLFWNLTIGRFLDLTDFITDFHYVLTNVVENMLMFMKLTKFGVFRVKWQPLAKFFAETENDHIIDNYKTKQDRMIFTNCKKITSKFFVITFSWMTLVLLSHYFKAVIPNILMHFLLKQY